MSEGDLEDWAAVARAISGRVRELGWRQHELAERSHASVTLVRETRRHTVERRPGTEIAKLLTELRSEIATVADHACDG